MIEMKGDDADGALEERVADAGERAHERRLHGVDGVGVEGARVLGELLLHRGGKAQHEGARLRRAVVERHVATVRLLLALHLLGVGVRVGVAAVEGWRDAVHEAHVHLALVVPGVLDGPAAPEELADLLASRDFLGSHVLLLTRRRLRGGHSLRMRQAPRYRRRCRWRGGRT